MMATQTSTATVRRVPRSCDIGRPLDSRPKPPSPSPGRFRREGWRQDMREATVYRIPVDRARSTVPSGPPAQPY